MNILTRYRETLIQKLDELLGGPPPEMGGHSPILAMCRYHVGLALADGSPRSAGGKMVRPALCLAMYESLATDHWGACVPVALAIELVHRTSLIYDDIQDHSPRRNHLPTVWTTWGVDQALNAGLALSCYARLALSGLDHGYVETHRLLEQTVIELCQGQYRDIEFQQRTPSLDEYLEMVRLKTGVLMGTACEVGALVAGADGKRAEARRFGESVGVAFQLWDDYLGVWGSEEALGKVPSDLKERKRSLPVVLAIRENSGEICRLLKAHPENQVVPRALKEVLDRMGIREVACAQVVEATRMAMENLWALDLDSSWQEAFQFLVGFVGERDV